MGSWTGASQRPAPPCWIGDHLQESMQSAALVYFILCSLVGRCVSQSVLRSPCGSGTAAVMAARHARGLLPLGEDFLHDGILATRFKGRLLAETQVISGSGLL